MQVARLLASLSVYELSGHLSDDLCVRSLQTNSQNVQEGDLFIAQRGTKIDSHDFVAQAVSKGACAILIEQGVFSQAYLSSLCIPVIQVRDTRRAMALLATCFYNYPSGKLSLIGVTGTNGKTSTVQFLYQLLSAAHYKIGIVGTLGLQYGDQVISLENTTPDIIPLQKSLDQLYGYGAKYVAVEVSSHALAMGRVRGCCFQVAILTNISRDHLDYHLTMENYIEAKKMLFSQLGSNISSNIANRPTAILNAHVTDIDTFLPHISGPVITYAVEKEADVQAINLEVLSSGTQFLLKTWQGEMTVTVPFIGRFHIENILAAISAALVLGVPLTSLKNLLCQLRCVTGRLERIDRNLPFAVWLDYAHTPDGLEQVLKTIRPQIKGKLYCLIGCGGNRDRGKRAQMANVAATLSDEAIFTSDNPRFEDALAILQEMEIGMRITDKSNFKIIVDRKAAIHDVINCAQAGDGVLIAGKGHEEYQEISGERIPFSDRLIAQEAMKEAYR